LAEGANEKKLIPLIIVDVHILFLSYRYLGANVWKLFFNLLKRGYHPLTNDLNYFFK
jgi:hypothetical protein